MIIDKLVMEGKTQKKTIVTQWASLILLAIGAILLSVAWYIITPGNELGWAFLSTIVLWPIIVVIASIVEIHTNSDLRGTYIVVALCIGFIVSFMVRFPGGTFLSGMLTILVFVAVQKTIHTNSSKK